ncbi:MAG: SDR family oxidoreductase [Gemmatimonadaceae bacterium]|nr:SDR family oxidoreductase [Gemmatimonadaceae bacterium]NUQ93295.1 SDR family oxidoreductase [Gemmatimonadaceae bacterium]NUR18925.1 SDR family oxidoreductase [Gemmatimonadaceae bacterium]NUS98828.1 SDR family oxidoreductase [Gemmatimonadaceae bacterium]
MDLGLNGKVALVAASSKGLGRAVAEELAAEGCDLVMCARGKEALEEAASSIRASSKRKVVALSADLSKPEDVSQVAARALNEFGRVDILVTNGGGPPAGPFESHSMEAWHAAVRQTLDSVVELTRAVLPGMKERRWGRIVNVTSIAVKQPVDNLILSNSVRAAVTGFARTLANEVAPFGITVNNVMPGYTRTDRVTSLAAKNAQLRGSTMEEQLASFEKQIPMGRLGEPRELGAMVAFLCSDRASYTTGASIPVDGGWIRALL